MITIAVDAMGGDNAPRPEVEAVCWARGNMACVFYWLAATGGARGVSQARGSQSPIEIVPASEVITMTDHPAQAFRRKKDSSVHVAARLVRETKADGLVSAGNTGR